MSLPIDYILNPRTPSAAELKAAFTVLLAASEAIREAHEIPAGTLYAMLMNRVDINGFSAMIRQLKNAGLVSESANLLTWIGPTLSDGPLPATSHAGSRIAEASRP